MARSFLTERNREVIGSAVDRYIADLKIAIQKDQGSVEGRPGTVGHELLRDLRDASNGVADTESVD